MITVSLQYNQRLYKITAAISWSAAMVQVHRKQHFTSKASQRKLLAHLAELFI